MGAITITVLRDVNGNGRYEPGMDLGVAGVGVIVSDDSGSSTTGVTALSGVVVVDPEPAGLSGGRYKVEVQRSSLPASLSAREGMRFVDARSAPVSVLFGLSNLAEDA